MRRVAFVAVLVVWVGLLIAVVLVATTPRVELIPPMVCERTPTGGEVCTLVS